MEAENVIEYSARLRERLPAFIQVEYLHGKMKPKEKNEIMERFLKNEIQVLVSTTVVEVGPDGSTTLLWENDHVLGLAPDGDGLLVPDPGDKIVDLAFKPTGGPTEATRSTWGRIKTLYR